MAISIDFSHTRNNNEKVKHSRGGRPLIRPSIVKDQYGSPETTITLILQVNLSLISKERN